MQLYGIYIDQEVTRYRRPSKGPGMYPSGTWILRVCRNCAPCGGISNGRGSISIEAVGHNGTDVEHVMLSFFVGIEVSVRIHFA